MLYVYIANRWIPILQPRQKHGHPILASLQGARWKDVRHFAIPGFCHMLQSPGSRSPKKVEPSFDVWKNSKTWCLMMLLSFLPCVFSEASFMWDVRGSEKNTEALHGDTSHHFSSCFSPNLPEDLGSGQGGLSQVEFKKQTIESAPGDSTWPLLNPRFGGHFEFEQVT